MRFIKKDDCYLDSQTGLEWALEDEPNTLKFRWDKSSNLENGWRVPTIKELLTIVDYEKGHPATELPGMQSDYYWSASTYAPDTLYAWLVDFFAGGVYAFSKPTNSYLRAVRGGSKQNLPIDNSKVKTFLLGLIKQISQFLLEI